MGGLTKLLNFIIAVLAALAILLELYQWVVSRFFSFADLVSVVVLALVAFVLANSTERMKALSRWARAQIAALTTGIHPTVQSRIDQEVQTVKKEMLNRLEARLAEHTRQVNDNVVAQVRKTLASRKHVKQTLFSDKELVVAQRGLRYAQIDVDVSQKSEVRIVGDFEASGGGGNDIRFIAFDERNFNKFSQNPPWPNTALDETPQTTRYAFAIPVFASGKYFLVFDNGFSTFSPKTVRFNVSIEYDTAAL
jgi:hypothetical protein